jgi:hypothetical protein
MMMNLLCPTLLAVLLATCNAILTATDALDPIVLGPALLPYAIIAGAAVTTTGTSPVTGRVGVSPGTSITGAFEGQPPLDSANAFSNPAKGDLQVAYDEAKDKDVGDGNPAHAVGDFIKSNVDLGGKTLSPGVYKFAAAASLNGDLSLSCKDKDGNDVDNPVWTFQIGTAMLFATNSNVIFLNDDSYGTPGTADQVTWQVGSSASIMGNVKVIGNVLAYASITSTALAVVDGRLLALNAAVTLISTTVVKPAYASSQSRSKKE